MDATVKIVIETYRKNKEGKHSVKLRVTHNRKPRYYSVKKYLKNDDWNYCTDQDELNDILKKTSKGVKKDIRLNYEAIERKAHDIINELPSFSFEKFEEKFYNKTSNWDYVFNGFEETLKDLKAENRLGYAESIHSTLTSIKFFMEKKDFSKRVQAKDYINFKKYKNLKFVDITVSWLKKYEQFLIKNGKSTSSIGIYTRNIRKIFNDAIKNHNVKAEYPFLKYQPKTSTNKKRALTIEQINQIATYEAPEGSVIQFTKDMFIFSFLANGMNITDIFRLKYKNLKKDEFEFSRYKNTNKNAEVKVTVALTDTLKKIIKRHGQKSLNSEVYIFPVLSGVGDEEAAFRLIKQKCKVMNQNLKKIAKEVGFEPELANDISTYYARHSYATITKNSGESIEYIKESLGHKSTGTTEKYLSSFDVEHRKKASDDLDSKIVGL